MYSLDQVIYFLEQRQQTEDWNIRDAAIAYLKGYREILPEYAQMKLDAVNDPLTWDELKTMEGKPVWVEALLYKQWVVIGYVGENHILFEGVKLYAPESRKYMGEEDGWQAYRKERG